MPEEKHSPIIEGLFERRTVVLSDEITSESVDRVSRSLLELQLRSKDDVTLIINSGGGSTYDALRLCTLIRSILTIKIRGVALDMCGSAATFIMLHCHERIGTPYSRYLIHSGSRSKITIPIGQDTPEHLEQLLRAATMVEGELLGMYMALLRPKSWEGRDVPDDEKRDFVQKLISRGNQRFNNLMSTQEAVEAGLIERVQYTNLNIFD